MTVIAWDGKTLACDSQVVCGDSIVGYESKIHPWSGGYWGSCGSYKDGVSFAEWLEDRDLKPKLSKDFSALFSEDGIVYESDSGLTPFKTLPNDCVGSGADDVRVLLQAGFEIEEAIRQACKHNTSIGGRVYSIAIKPKRGSTRTDVREPIK